MQEFLSREDSCLFCFEPSLFQMRNKSINKYTSVFVTIMLMEETGFNIFCNTLEGVIIADKKPYLKECDVFLVTCNKAM